jgi:8-oxo-dGTP diphosphatase
MRAEKLCHIYLAKPIFKKCDPTEQDHTAVFVDIDAAYQILAVDGDAYFLKKFSEGTY